MLISYPVSHSGKPGVKKRTVREEIVKTDDDASRSGAFFCAKTSCIFLRVMVIYQSCFNAGNTDGPLPRRLSGKNVYE